MSTKNNEISSDKKETKKKDKEKTKPEPEPESESEEEKADSDYDDLIFNPLELKEQKLSSFEGRKGLIYGDDNVEGKSIQEILEEEKKQKEKEKKPEKTINEEYLSTLPDDIDEKDLMKSESQIAYEKQRKKTVY